jgi:hypothetical protein
MLAKKKGLSVHALSRARTDDKKGSVKNDFSFFTLPVFLYIVLS